MACWGGIVISVAGCRTVASSSTGARRDVAFDSGVVAMVGHEVVSSEVVSNVRDASSVAAARALEEVIHSRLLGRWAREGGLAAGRRHQIARALLARSLLERVEGKVREPPIEDEEIERATKLRWYEFDRPEARRTVHVLVKLEKGTREDAAMDLARQVANAVKGRRQASQFLEIARSIPAGSLKIVAESLPHALADGRVLALDSNGKPAGEGGTFDADFARAAFQLKEPGDQSGIVRTAFGFHVVFFESRLEGHVVPLEERRKLLAADVLKQRAQLRIDEMLGAGRKIAAPSVERSALELTSRVRISP
jgi:hypothetical protein